MPASPKFKTIITDYGKQRLIAAMSPGGTKLTLTQMAVGDGGGNPTNPDTTNTTLINEVWRAAVNSVSVDKKHSNIIIVELLIPAEVGGFWIREAGIYDEFNKLVAICSLPASEKPLLEQGSGRAQTVRMTLVISDLSTINITIDSTTIIATNDYVDNSLKEHEKSRNHPDATLTDKGFVKLYSGVTSIDETMAATPKAVKIAMDNASARLAKERNLADLPSIPLALSNLTLADVKKYVESTNTGVDKLPIFRPASEDDLDALPAGYMGLCKNKTPGGPLPGERWYYIDATGKLDNNSNDPKRKGGVITLTRIDSPGDIWRGVKFDDGVSGTVKYTWSRDFNTLNKPTPEDVGLAATKKAIDDTQTGLAVQGVMWISTADDLSNLPSGAHRFARNNTGVTVLPSDGYFFLEVLAKRDVANGSCILAKDDRGNVWIGTRYTVPADVAFTWIQLNQTVENLDLTETVKLAAGAVPLNKDGSVDSIKTLKDVGNIFAGQLVLIDRLSAVGTDTKFDVMFNARDAGGNVRWAYGPYKNGWDIHSYSPDGAWRANPLHVDYNTSEVFVPCNFHVGGAIIAIDGNIWGTRWKAGGAWLWDTIAEQLAIRDNNTNARSTIDYVNQTFVRDVRAGYLETTQVWRAYGYGDQAPYVITGVMNGNTDDLIDNLTRRPFQKNINSIWYNIDFI